MDPNRPYDPSNAAQQAFVVEVLRRLDEVSRAGNAPREHEDRIYAAAVEAADVVLRSAPLRLVAPLAVALDDFDDLVDGTRKVGIRAQASTAYLRLVGATTTNWRLTVVEPLPYEGNENPYALEFNPHRRRSVTAPVVYEVPTPDGVALDLFPRPPVTTPSTAVQVLTRVRPDAVAGVAPQLGSVIAYGAASRYLISIREPDVAAATATLAEQALAAL